MPAQSELKDILPAAGAIVALGGAIILAWKGRAKWEPSEEDVPGGPRKLAALASGLIITTLWLTTTIASLPWLLKLSGVLTLGALMALLIYGYLVGTMTFTRIVLNDKQNETKDEKVIGGFRLTDTAKAKIREKQLTVQEYFAGTAYNVDAVWERGWRSIAKQCFVLAYILLIVCGSIALGAGANALRLTTEAKAKAQEEAGLTKARAAKIVFTDTFDAANESIPYNIQPAASHHRVVPAGVNDMGAASGNMLELSGGCTYQLMLNDVVPESTLWGRTLVASAQIRTAGIAVKPGSPHSRGKFHIAWTDPVSNTPAWGSNSDGFYSGGKDRWENATSRTETIPRGARDINLYFGIEDNAGEYWIDNVKVVFQEQ